MRLTIRSEAELGDIYRYLFVFWGGPTCLLTEKYRVLLVMFKCNVIYILYRGRECSYSMQCKMRYDQSRYSTEYVGHALEWALSANMTWGATSQPECPAHYRAQ